jgi:hypothetical protein
MDTKSRVKPDPAEAVAMAMIAWHNGLLKIGKTKAEDVPLPWNLRIFAWATRKMGIGLLDLVFIHKKNPTNWGLFKGVGGILARRLWRWLRIY